ncbi:hypothetical protein P7C73_g6181, partial [Tremellales sp. Uapishka_1]
MICLRRRNLAVRASQRAELDRLRGPSHATNTTPASSSSTPAPRWSPFEALRSTLLPYSILYIKGTADGVIGRYQEEMEFDDGQYDFGDLSRGYMNAKKAKRNYDDEVMRIERLDWGEHGSLLHLPLTSLFHPILSIPQTLDRLFTPTLHFLEKYSASFSDGSQGRTISRLSEEVTTGGAWRMLGKIRGHWDKKIRERAEEIRQEGMKKVAERGDGDGVEKD